MKGPYCMDMVSFFCKNSGLLLNCVQWIITLPFRCYMYSLFFLSNTPTTSVFSDCVTVAFERAFFHNIATRIKYNRKVFIALFFFAWAKGTHQRLSVTSRKSFFVATLECARPKTFLHVAQRHRYRLQGYVLLNCTVIFTKQASSGDTGKKRGSLLKHISEGFGVEGG